jgi:hypothetical protein
MKLPNRENAYIAPPKLTDYLLSETHPVGKSKARLLRAVGFDETNVHLLEQHLLAISHSGEVEEVEATPHGTKYVVEGPLPTPVGGILHMRTVWIIDTGQSRPRFVTAYCG